MVVPMAMQVLTLAFIIPGGRDSAPLCRGAWELGMRPGTDRQQRAHQRYRQGKIVFEIPQVPFELESEMAIRQQSSRQITICQIWIKSIKYLNGNLVTVLKRGSPHLNVGY